MAEDPADGRSELLSYEQIAELLGVKQTSVRIYAVRDDRFPTPVPESKPRQPRFARADVEAYIEQRNARGSGSTGRPARTAPTRRAPAPGGDYGARVRAAIASGRHEITTQHELAQLLGISKINLGRRLNGQASWKRSETRLIETKLGVRPTRGLLLRLDDDEAKSA